MEIINSYGNVQLGENYSLACVVTGADKLNPMLSYEWTRNGNRLEMIDNETNVLSFTPFRLSDAGNYHCNVSICSQYVNDAIMIESNNQSLKVQGKSSTE